MPLNLANQDVTVQLKQKQICDKCRLCAVDTSDRKMSSKIVLNVSSVPGHSAGQVDLSGEDASVRV